MPVRRKDGGPSGKQLRLCSWIYRLLAELHLVRSETERDGILPRGRAFKDMAAIFDGDTALTAYYNVHQFLYLYYTLFWKETPCAIAKIQPENLCPPGGCTVLKEHFYKGAFKVNLE